MKDKIEFIAFDADDTLWENELHCQEFERKFCHLLACHLPASTVSRELLGTEMKNLRLYGYGLKGMMLSMIETACRIIGKDGKTGCIEEIINIGQELLEKPVELLEGSKEVLTQLYGKYKLVLATKGDLFDQQRKIAASGLQEYFCHIEIMSDKKDADYRKLLGNIVCSPENFLMIGNSIKSDILPVLELGGYAVHIPHHVTWAYEQYEGEIKHPRYLSLNTIGEVPGYL